MSLSGKAGAARSQERGWHAVSKFRRAVRVKITIEAVEREATFRRNLRGRRLSVREGELMRRRAPLCPGELYAWPLYMDINCAGERNWRRRYRTPNFDEADLVRAEMWSFQLRFWVDRGCLVLKRVIAVCCRRIGDRSLEGYVELIDGETEFLRHWMIPGSFCPNRKWEQDPK